MVEEETVLLMLSGGIDSTYLLYDYLDRTRLRVHAHHVSLRYPHLERWRAEDEACERIVAWCRTHLRSFEYSSSRFDLDFERIGWDSDLILTVASKVALNLGPSPVTVALGWCSDDLERPEVRARQERDVTGTIWKALRESISEWAEVADRVSMPIPAQGLGKADLIERLPGELLQLTWSCRRPAWADGVPSACGRCQACLQRLKAVMARIEVP